MSDNNENISSENVAKAKVQYTVEYILSQIADIQKQTTYLNEAITKLSIMSDGDSGDCGSPGNIQGQANAQAFGDIVRCRETTNQQMLKLYEKMYDNLTTSKSNTPVEFDKWNAISKLADVAMHDDDFAGERNEMLDSIRQILRENK